MHVKIKLNGCDYYTPSLAITTGYVMIYFACIRIRTITTTFNFLVEVIMLLIHFGLINIAHYIKHLNHPAISYT